MQVATAFGLVLKRRRNLAHHTQESLGFEAELQRNFISELERGLKSPSLGTVCQLARALGCSAAEMVNEAEAVMLGLQAAAAPGRLQPAVHETPGPYSSQAAPAPARTAGRTPKKPPPAQGQGAQPDGQGAAAKAKTRPPKAKSRQVRR